MRAKPSLCPSCQGYICYKDERCSELLDTENCSSIWEYCMVFLGTWVVWVQFRKPWAEILDFPILERFQRRPKMTTARDPIKSKNRSNQSFLKRKKRLTPAYQSSHPVSVPPFVDAREMDELREMDDSRETCDEGVKSGTPCRVEIEAKTQTWWCGPKKKKRAACRKNNFPINQKTRPSNEQPHPNLSRNSYRRVFVRLTVKR